MNKKNQTMLLAILLAVPLGFIVGILDVIFGKGLLYLSEFRGAHLWFLVPFLPIAGLVIVYSYQHFGKNSQQGMGLLFDEARSGESIIPKRLIPLAICSTWLTHLFGGSAGREGVAVQLGGTLGSIFGRYFSLPNMRKILLLTGMAAGFGGLFQTPIAATFFALEVMVVGKIELQNILPCMIGSSAASATAHWLALEKFTHKVSIPSGIQIDLLWKVALAAVLFGLCGLLFSVLLKHCKKTLSRYFPNPYWKIFMTGILLAVLLLFCHSGRYTGLGTNLIATSFNGGEILPYDWLLKIFLTVLTLAAGFQGGEVTPLFAIGAALGTVCSGYLGVPSDMLAALGYVAVFSAATNTYFAPIFICGEVFGFSLIPYAFFAISIAYGINGNRSIYGKQLTWEEELNQ